MIHRTPSPRMEPDFIQTNFDEPEPITDLDIEMWEQICNEPSTIYCMVDETVLCDECGCCPPLDPEDEYPFMEEK